MSERPKTLSRLDAVKGREALYLSKYWKEHKDNIHDFFFKMIEAKTLAKLTSNASEICIRLAKQYRMAPNEYCDRVIKQGYLNLEKGFELVNDAKSAKEKKTQFLDFIQLYFDFVSKNAKESSASPDQIAKIFASLESNDQFRPFAQGLLGEKYDSKECSKYFYPQLIYFFGRFFDVYDGSIQGRLVSEAMEAIEKEHKTDHVQKLKSDPSKLSSTWSKANSSAPIGPTPVFSYDRNEEPSNPQVEETLESLSEAFINAKLDLTALYRHKGEEFLEKWSQISEEEKKKWMDISRANVESRAEMGMMYCPEINGTDLSKNGGKAMLDMLEECRNYADNISVLDDFVNKIWLAMKAKGIESKKGLLTIAFSRRWTLCTFCVNVIVETLQLAGQSSEESSTETPNSVPTPSFEQIVDKALSSIVKDLPKKDKSNPLERADPALKKCAYSKCNNRETATQKFQVCGKCKAVDSVVPYCSRNCQAKHWNQDNHKAVCGIRKEPELKTSDRVETIEEEVDREEREEKAMEEAMEEFRIRKREAEEMRQKMRKDQNKTN
eukprot:TRINITY_DN3101_c0_g1_i1.p1 TRINITY_DN3101_c0_g1~~TRINITY_DN3101_c0_g1_i1.p1  ORF type:complete len:552 (+),score=184.33 TRINITY_DN3101_c0_g1_i1:1074-2729(+)